MAKKNKNQQQSTANDFPDDDENTVGVLSVFGYHCPVVFNCCFCIPLKTASYIIAGLGILPTIACIFLALPPGQKLLHENGLPKWYYPGLKWIYGSLGAFVFSIHMILSVAIALQNRRLLVFYLWSLLAYMAGSSGIALIISAEIIRDGHVKFGMGYLSLTAIYTLILYYFWVVINSELYVEKKSSDVINIHITIM